VKLGVGRFAAREVGEVGEGLDILVSIVVSDTPGETQYGRETGSTTEDTRHL
jgi:hypothetical protein